MTEWTQSGWVVVADSALGGPMVASFHPGRAMAEASLARNTVDPKEWRGTVMEKAMSTLRILPATLTFDDGKPD